jgi:hypothetical protein
VGDEVNYQNLALTVLSTKGRRITKVKVIRHSEGNHPADQDEDPPQQHAHNGAQPDSRSHSERTSASNLHTE